MTNYDERKFIVEFLEVYRDLPALWDVKCKDYNNRQVKEQQYDTLLKKYQEINPKAEKKDVSRKINCIRTNYRREMKRLRDLFEKTGEMEAPSLYYFELLDSFLKDMETPAALARINNANQANDTKTNASRCNSSLKRETVSLDSKPTKSLKKRMFGRSTVDELVTLASKRLKPGTPIDSSQQMAAVWADKLSNMERNQRIIAEKVISEVMFNGELGLLNFNTGLTHITSPSSIYCNENSNSSPIPSEFKVEIVRDLDAYEI